MKNHLIVLTDNIVKIKPFELENAKEHLAGEDDEQIKWLSGGKSNLKGVKNWILKNEKYWEEDGPRFTFAIFTIDKDKLIGMVEANSDLNAVEGLKKDEVNISYGLYPFARGQGYATRAVKLILEFLKSKKIKRTAAAIMVESENISSLKVPQRCGFIENRIITTKKGKKLIIFVKKL